MRTVLVTGGTMRLGRIIAEHLKGVGWRVLVSSHREDSEADVVADLSVSGGAEKLYAEALRLLGGEPPEALVNNAAIFAGNGDKIKMVNLQSPMRLTELMAERKEGRGLVVNILDCRARDGDYGRSKAELRAYTFRSARELSATLRVNAVSPGPVLRPVGVLERAGETPVGRPLPEDVAKAVSFLLETASITGCDIAVDGGQHLL